MVKKRGYWLGAIFIIAFLLRAGMMKNSLWLDEAYSVRQAAFSQQDIWIDKVDPAHPPLYYALLHEWINLAGTGETAVRLPSLLISLMNIGLLYLLARLLFDEDLAMIAASLLAVAPLDIWYAGEARMYTFVAFAGLLAAVGLVWKHWLGMLVYGAAILIGLYLDYTFLPLWAAITAVWLVYWWLDGHQLGRLGGWLLMSLLAVWLYQPWYSHLAGLLVRLSHITLFMKLEETIGIPSLQPEQYLLLLPLMVATTMIGAYLLWQLLRRERLRYLLTILILAGFILLTLLIPLPRAYTLKRVIVTGWPFLLLLVAWLVGQWPGHRKRVWLGLFGISLFSSIVMILAIPKDDWRGVVAYADARISDFDIVLIDPSYNDIPYNYYQPNLQPQRMNTDELAKTAVTNIWLVVERFPGSVDQVTPSEQWLNENRTLAESIPFYRLELRRYTP